MNAGTTPRGSYGLVGRGDELVALLGAVRRPPALVLLEGEAGVGKTRLLQEANDVLRRKGARVLVGHCYPLREPAPYQPVIDALRDAVDLLPGNEALSPQTRALAPFLPELGHMLPAPPPGSPPAAPSQSLPGRMEVKSAVRALLTAVGPLVLVIEDLHWVDEATQDLLLLLLRDLPPQTSLVLSYRQEDLRRSVPVLGSALRCPAEVTCTEIRLTPLAASEVREMALRSLGARATSEVCRLLYTRSAGLPLVIEEDLVTLHGRRPDRDVDERAVLAGSEVPRSLREAMAERTARLSPDNRLLVRAAAVLAVPARQALLADITGLEPERVTAGLLDALDAAVLHELGAGLYGFRHALAQQAAYDELRGPEREALHRDIVRALWRQPDPPLVQIAHHTRALGDTAEWLKHAKAAVDQAVSLGDGGTAAALLREIINYHGTSTDLRVEAAVSLAGLAFGAADYEATAEALKSILSAPGLPVGVRGEIRGRYGVLMINQGGDPAGLEQLEQAVEELHGRPALAARASAGAALGYLWRAADVAKARSWLRKAEETVRRSDDETAWSGVRLTKITAEAALGNAEALELFEQVPKEPSNPELARQATVLFYNVGQSRLGFGFYDRAGKLLEEARQRSRQQGMEAVGCLARATLLMLQWYTGDWRGLEERQSALFDEYPEMRVSHAEGMLVLGHLAAARGERGRALRELQKAADLRAGIPYDLGYLEAVAAIAAVHLATSDTRAAWRTVEPVMAGLRSDGVWVYAGDFLPVAVETAIAVRRRPAAEVLVAAAAAGIGPLRAPGLDAALHLARGHLLAGVDHAAAAEHFRQARLLWQQIGRPYAAAQAAELHARAIGRDLPDEVDGELAEALRTYTRLGAFADAARAQQLLRGPRSGSPGRPQGTRGYGNALSPRELQVARLLAAGSRNPEIAQSLMLSTRTVEHHVARILKKLEVADRKEVSSALQDYES